MQLLVAALGLLLAVLGGVGIVSPGHVLGLVERFATQRGLYGIAALRLAIGAALVLAAPDTRAPRYLQVFGILAFVSGLVTPFFGVERFRALLGWWRGQPPGFLRVWCVVVLGIGLSFLWAAL